MKSIFLGLVFLFNSYTVVASVPKLTFSYGEVNTYPQVILSDDGDIKSGILFDLANAIGSELNIQIEFLKTPRARLEQLLLDKFVDINCTANPKWLTSSELIWSEPLYDNPDLLINQLNLSSVEQLITYAENKITPTLIGTVLGYRYPSLEPLFDRGKLVRIDSLSPSISYQRYLRGDFPMFVIAKTEASIIDAAQTQHSALIDHNYLYCALSPALKSEMKVRILGAINTIKTSGKLEALISKYQVLDTTKTIGQ
ncbi:substrate-binding periplasmic protein [Pseudoalteromonas xiamenensis]